MTDFAVAKGPMCAAAPAAAEEPDKPCVAPGSSDGEPFFTNSGPTGSQKTGASPAPLAGAAGGALAGRVVLQEAPPRRLRLVVGRRPSLPTPKPVAARALASRGMKTGTWVGLAVGTGMAVNEAYTSFKHGTMTGFQAVMHAAQAASVGALAGAAGGAAAGEAAGWFGCGVVAAPETAGVSVAASPGCALLGWGVGAGVGWAVGYGVTFTLDLVETATK